MHVNRNHWSSPAGNLAAANRSYIPGWSNSLPVRTAVDCSSSRSSSSVPIIGAAYYSFTNYDLLTAPEWAGFKNYAKIGK